MSNEGRALTATEVAEEMSVHPETVRRWTRQGLLPAIKLPSGRRRYRREDVDALKASVPA